MADLVEGTREGIDLLPMGGVAFLLYLCDPPSCIAIHNVPHFRRRDAGGVELSGFTRNSIPGCVSTPIYCFPKTGMTSTVPRNHGAHVQTLFTIPTSAQNLLILPDFHLNLS